MVALLKLYFGNVNAEFFESSYTFFGDNVVFCAGFLLMQPTFVDEIFKKQVAKFSTKVGITQFGWDICW
jgi:hypothetical protein